jgi:hypothetical protein
MREEFAGVPVRERGVSSVGVHQNGNIMAQKKKAQSKAAQYKTWVVTTSADRPITEVAKDLSAAGFKIDQTLDAIGVITGKSDDKAAKKARGVRGVTDISPDNPVDIGPPNSRETW